MLIYPSILTLDFSQLESQIKAAVAGGADGIHVDVMDGQFVPPITFGSPIIEAINSVTNLPLDIHMMVIEPDRFFADFAGSGAKSITVHFEAVEDIEQTLTKLDSLGVNKSLALNPGTEIEKSFPYPVGSDSDYVGQPGLWRTKIHRILLTEDRASEKSGSKTRAFN